MSHTTPTPIEDNPAYVLDYQLDSMLEVSYITTTSPMIRGTFLRVEHGSNAGPFTDFMLCLN